MRIAERPVPEHAFSARWEAARPSLDYTEAETTMVNGKGGLGKKKLESTYRPIPRAHR